VKTKLGRERHNAGSRILAAASGLLLLGAAACTVESAPPPRRVYYPPPPAAYYPAPPRPGYPAPPAPPGYAPPYAQRPAPPVANGGYYAPPPAPPAPPNAFANETVAVHTAAPPLNLQHPAPLPFLDAINIQAVAMAAARSGRGCGPRQVAPNVWIQIDCLAYSPILAAIPHMSALKLTAVNAKSPAFRAFNLATLSPQLSNAFAADSYPATVDHRTDGGEGPVKDQGMVGDCTAFSLSSVMENQLRRGKQTTTVSPTHLWSHYGNPDMAKAGDTNLKKSITTFELWPYSGKEACELETDSDPDCVTAYGVQTNSWQSDPQAKAHELAASAAGRTQITEIDKLSTPVNIQEWQSVLASGSDIWAGLRIDSNSWNNSNQKGNHTIPDWLATDGGHAVAIAGYRTGATGIELLVHNSWGTSWGDKGYAWVSQNMVSLFTQYAYKVKVGGVAGAAPAGAPVVPVTPAAVTDDDCNANDLLDYFTGQCAVICPNGARPNNGKCT
jgi:hypothetical protein